MDIMQHRSRKIPVFHKNKNIQLRVLNRSWVLTDRSGINPVIIDGVARSLALRQIADPLTELPTKEGQIAQKKDGTKGMLIAEKDGDGNLYWIDKIGGFSPSWGSIIGNIQSQSDLQQSLDSKIDTDGVIDCDIT